MTESFRNARWDWRAVVVGCVLFFGTLLVFNASLGNGFLDLDDPDYVTQNVHVKSGLTFANIRWAITSSASANWHPLTWISLMADAQLYGDFARGFHFTNVFFHALGAVVAFLALRKLTGMVWPSAFCAALFAWHPLRVESVAWIAERKDVLSGLFFWLTLLAYAGYVEKTKIPGRKPGAFYLITILCFVFGLMSKPMLVTVPFLLLLLDFWPLQRAFGFALILEKIPLIALSFGSCVVTFLVQKNWGAVVESQAFGDRMANAVVSVARYIGRFFCPGKLAIVYPLPTHWPALVIAAAAFLVVVSTVIACIQMKRRPWFFVGWFWFLGMFVPVIGVVQVGLQAMADRYTYLPAVGLQIAIIWSLCGIRFPASRALKPLLAITALVTCVALAQRQINFWRNPKVLYEHALAVTQSNYLAECYLGTTLLNDNRLADAIAHFNRALEMKPDFSDARFKLGVAFTKTGDEEKALTAFHELLVRNPRHALAEYNSGIILLGQNRIAEAILHLQGALQKKPGYDSALVALGTAEAKLGNAESAINYFKQALALKPENAIAEYNFANALTDLNHQAEALPHYERALQIDPDFEEAHCNYANVLGTSGHPIEARDHFRRTLMLNPQNAAACFGLAVAFEELGNIAGAMACYRRAIEIEPQNAMIHFNFATVLLNQNCPADALVHFQNAARLQPENSSAILGVGLAEERLGNAQEAILNYRQAITFAPENAQAYCCLGIALRRAGRYSEAIDEIETALRLNPKLSVLQEQLKLARNALAAERQ